MELKNRAYIHTSEEGVVLRPTYKNLAKYSELAYNSLPAEFLSFMQISTKGDADQITFKEVK
jgi:hypothetical protein